MRLTRSICAAALVTATACSGSLTAPPSGLPATLSTVETPDGQVPSITSAGDSVIAFASNDTGSPCGSAPTVAAGLRGNGLVMTITRHPRNCPPGSDIAPEFPFQIVVHEVPPGTRSATVVLRLVGGDNATYFRLASGTITLP